MREVISLPTKLYSFSEASENCHKHISSRDYVTTLTTIFRNSCGFPNTLSNPFYTMLELCVYLVHIELFHRVAFLASLCILRVIHDLYFNRRIIHYVLTTT
jgi:hypothetical protein